MLQVVVRFLKSWVLPTASSIGNCEMEDVKNHRDSSKSEISHKIMLVLGYRGDQDSVPPTEFQKTSGENCETFWKVAQLSSNSYFFFFFGSMENNISKCYYLNFNQMICKSKTKKDEL